MAGIVATAARVACLILFASLASHARAEGGGTFRPVNPESFAEKFSGNTQVSGRLLVGLSYRSKPEKLDPAAIQLMKGEGQVCVRLTTEDGRYWSSNLFEHSGGGGGPSALSFRTAYLKQLQSYSTSGLMVLAVKTDDCARIDGQPLVPGIVGTREKDGAALLAFVNVSQGRTTAWLERDGQAASEKSSCSTPQDGPRVTFSVVCSLPAADKLAGEYTLQLSVRSLTGGTIQESYRVVFE